MSIEDVSIRLNKDEQTFEDFMSPELTRIHKAVMNCTVMKCMARKLYRFDEETK